MSLAGSTGQLDWNGAALADSREVGEDGISEAQIDQELLNSNTAAGTVGADNIEDDEEEEEVAQRDSLEVLFAEDDPDLRQELEQLRQDRGNIGLTDMFDALAGVGPRLSSQSGVKKARKQRIPKAHRDAHFSMLRANSNYADGNYDKAISYALQAIKESRAKSSEAFGLLASISRDQGDENKAANYEMCKAIFLGRKQEAYSQWMDCFDSYSERLKMPHYALYCAGQAARVAVSPNDKVYALLMRGWVFLQLGDQQKGYTSYSKAIEVFRDESSLPNIETLGQLLVVGKEATDYYWGMFESIPDSHEHSKRRVNFLEQAFKNFECTHGCWILRCMQEFGLADFKSKLGAEVCTSLQCNATDSDFQTVINPLFEIGVELSKVKRSEMACDVISRCFDVLNDTSDDDDRRISLFKLHPVIRLRYCTILAYSQPKWAIMLSEIRKTFSSFKEVPKQQGLLQSCMPAIGGFVDAVRTSLQNSNFVDGAGQMGVELTRLISDAFGTSFQEGIKNFQADPVAKINLLHSVLSMLEEQYRRDPETVLQTLADVVLEAACGIALPDTGTERAAEVARGYYSAMQLKLCQRLRDKGNHARANSILEGFTGQRVAKDIPNFQFRYDLIMRQANLAEQTGSKDLGMILMDLFPNSESLRDFQSRKRSRKLSSQNSSHELRKDEDDNLIPVPNEVSSSSLPSASMSAKEPFAKWVLANKEINKDNFLRNLVFKAFRSLMQNKNFSTAFNFIDSLLEYHYFGEGSDGDNYQLLLMAISAAAAAKDWPNALRSMRDMLYDKRLFNVPNVSSDPKANHKANAIVCILGAMQEQQALLGGERNRNSDKSFVKLLCRWYVIHFQDAPLPIWPFFVATALQSRRPQVALAAIHKLRMSSVWTPQLALCAAVATVNIFSSRTCPDRRAAAVHIFAHLQQYIDLRRKDERVPDQLSQEIWYNVGKTLHMIGMFTEAYRCYSSCYNSLHRLPSGEDFKPLAAFNLFVMSKAAGNKTAAMYWGSRVITI